MKKIKIGVLCPSEIAYRRFMPALAKSTHFEFGGIAHASASEWFGEPKEELISTEKSKAQNFVDNYGGKLFNSYEELLTSPEINAVYIPLPPALHFRWAKRALEEGKHVLLEKPFTTALSDTDELLKIAGERELAVHENYMFVYHTQLEWIREKVSAGAIGDVRLIRIDFGFPFRGANDFRYDKALGGGALLDCGGYTVKLAAMLLGETAQITTSRLNSKDGFEVDIYGNATLTNADGLTAQISFGMDNSYKCSLEIWGSTGTIYTNRILTAPDGFEPTVIIKQGNDEQSFTLPADDTFRKSIEFFGECVDNKDTRTAHYREIRHQAWLVEKIIAENKD